MEHNKQERKLSSASRRFHTLAGRSHGSIVCIELSEFQKTKK